MLIKKGLEYFPEALTEKEINLIEKELDKILKQAPFFKPTMPRSGQEFSVKMTNAGNCGWVSDRLGYRYQKHHPETNKPWPVIPEILLKIWHDYTRLDIIPDCCLINYYDQNAKMGLHTDNDESDFSYPVLSISLYASAVFKIGGLKRSDKTQSLKLNHGDIIVFGGESRLIYHGISKIYPSTKYPHRINLTFRKI